MYVDPSIAYFGSSHIGYAIITLLLAFVVLIIPIILLFLYPCQCFQKCLNRFHLQLLPLHAFVDAFQGCYKDGTNGTRDCRYFIAIQLVLRLLLPFFFFMTQETMSCLFLFAFILCLYIALFVIVQPYKITVHNRTDVPLLITLLIGVFSSNAYTNYHGCVKYAVCLLCACAPLLYLVIWFAVHIKHIISHRMLCRKHTQETDQLLTDGE